MRVSDPAHKPMYQQEERQQTLRYRMEHPEDECHAPNTESRGPEGYGPGYPPPQQSQIGELLQPRLNERAYRPDELPVDDLLLLLPGNAYCKVRDVFIQDRAKLAADPDKVYAVPLAKLVERYDRLSRTHQQLRDECLHLKRELARGFYKDAAADQAAADHHV